MGLPVQWCGALSQYGSVMEMTEYTYIKCLGLYKKIPIVSLCSRGVPYISLSYFIIVMVSPVTDIYSRVVSYGILDNDITLVL